MSFGGGFGGFGQSNNQQQSTGFGGFGTNNTTTNTGTGFGSTPNTGGFGSTNTTGGGLFGGGSTGFGGSGGAFGSNTTNNAFGATKPAFGATGTGGGSLFGGGGAATTTGGSGFGTGGFGSASTTSTSPFGGGTTGTGGLFGSQNKPAFGGSPAANPFGGAPSNSPFGSTGTGAFGAPQSTALTTTGVGESPGTGNVPFSAFVEKEPNSSTNQQNAFQSICFQQPYQKFSPEELRLTDYAQGRRFGNGSSQPGAFGQTNFGGGFGNTTTNTTGGFGNSGTSGTTSLFGGGGTSNTGFGATQPASTGFGAGSTTTGGSLFGAKPATGGLFGGQTSTQPSGGLFGNTGTTTAFGATGTTSGFGAGTSTNTGGSLFGNNNTTANKPAFSFGSTQPAATTGTGFGASTTTGGFGGGSGGLFGNNTANQPATGFGAQQPAASNPFGGFGSNTQQQTGTTGGLFGNTQSKPAGGLFGNTPAATGTTGLFGNTTTTNANPFGGTTNTQNTGGLFGNNKPATTGTGLFGATNTQNNTGGGGLFSGFGNQNQNQQQQNTSGLFGGLNNNSTQQKPSLFGAQPQQQTGGGFFGNSSTQQQQGGGLFGGLNNTNNQQQQQQQQQPQNSIFGSSIFGGSQQGQQNPQSLTASIADNNAFGSASLFQDLATGPTNPGPIATPLSHSVKPKKAAAIPVYRLSSASNYRFTTPQKRGFGFSYSNYGTPGSVSSTSSTPGAFSGSLLGGGSFGRTLNKSMSTSSLRRSFSTEDSILAPGAFSASPSLRQFGSTGSVKKLTINRSIRQDLFSPPNGTPALPPASAPVTGALRKRVSFDQNTTGGGTASPAKQANGATPSAEELGYLRPRASVNGAKPNGTSTPPEMEQVNNNQQLAIVTEEEPVAPVATQQPAKPVSQEDQPAGNYYMRPSKEEIENMNRQQRSKVTGFVVGREGIGEIRFDVPVDLTSVPLDDIIDNIVQLSTRSATVYAIASKKPPMGKGLNVPSTISLGNSWPRKSDRKTPSSEKSGARFKKHIERLKRVPDTTFVDYDKDTGVWTFKVEHFTTYGFPEDDDETDGEGMSEFGQSTLSAPPDTPTPKTRTPKSVHMDRSFASTSQVTQTESDPDDTFEFRKKKLLPGAFDDQEAYVGDDMEQDQESFLDERSVGSQSEDGVEEPMDQDDVFHDDESVSIMDQEMAGSFPEAGNTAELHEDSQDDDEDMDMVAATPGAITRARLRAKNAGTPVKRQFAASNDWANTLKTTISPQKQDRAYLKSLADEEGDQLRPLGEPTPKPRRVVSDGRGFANSIDMMHSLFPDSKSPVKTAKATATSKGFQFPYAKRAKTGDFDTSSMNDRERAFHESMKPSWGPEGTLVYAAPPNAKPFGRSSRRARERDGILTVQKQAIVSENRDIYFAKFSNEASADLLRKQKDMTIVDDSGDVPFASLPEHFSFVDFFDQANPRDPAAAHEKLVWQLASILFDPLAVPVELQQVSRVVERLRMDNLSAFWQKLVDDACSKHIAMGRTSEEKAIAALSGHRIPDACAHLLESRDFHLATLVALIGTKDSMKKDMREQLNEWQNSQMLSEFSQSIRTIYELLAGNVCVCDGSKGQPEDRIESFIISKRFGLDWRQAFGLRLWYGIMSSDTIETAVESFAEDLAQDKETSRPLAWYVEQKVPTLWDDKALEDREDLLWGLLKLYTFTNSDIEDVLRPENSQLSPLDVRLSWQLGQALTANGAVRYTEDDEDKADRTTLAFAAQLTNEGSWLDAVFVLLHLSMDDVRAKSIQDHLAHHAGKIGSEDSSSFTTLRNTFKIPASWIWEAKALYMRSVEKNSRGEVECLIRAGAFNEAHRTFSKEVAPNAVVELDYDTLRTLLGGFHNRESTISEWHLGGEIYQDFLELLDSEKRGSSVDQALLARLLAGLPAVVEESRHPAFMERVAIETISGVVAKTVVSLGKKGEKSELHKVLRLPLTEDKYLKHTVELSLEYYRGVMANAQ
ncbi:Nuclear protein 96 domain containing protein [Hyaloscypha variabilis]